jgi:hypothetical protein
MGQIKRLYPYLITYGLIMGSLESSIQSLVKEAFKAKAPEKAIFQREDGTWATTDNLKPKQRRYIEDIVNDT